MILWRWEITLLRTETTVGGGREPVRIVMLSSLPPSEAYELSGQWLRMKDADGIYRAVNVDAVESIAVSFAGDDGRPPEPGILISRGGGGGGGEQDAAHERGPRGGHNMKTCRACRRARGET